MARLGLRSRLFLVVLLAGAPAFVLGATEAQRAYDMTVERERSVTRLVAEQSAARVFAMLDNRWQALELTAALPQVRDNAPSCMEVLRAVAATQSFVGVSRSWPNGRLACSSVPTPPGMVLHDHPWWRRVVQGQTTRDASSFTIGPISGLPVLILAAPVGARGSEGVLSASIEVSTIEGWLADARAEGRGVYLFDRDNRLMADFPGAGLDPKVAFESARTAAASGFPAEQDRQLAWGVRDPTSGVAVSVVSAQLPPGLGLSAAVGALAPLLATLLGIAAVLMALEVWVLRYFRELEHRAASFAAGIGQPALMRGAPADLHHLADAMEDAFTRARSRERDLEQAALQNRRLSRELHHRVKNNLQVMASLINRQQKRTGEPVVRAAIAEARARLLAVALVHRFIDPPEHLGRIQFEAYLSELARQLHAALAGDARGVTLHLEIEPGEAVVDFATVVGLIVAEALIGGYRAVVGQAGARAVISWKHAPRRLMIEILTPTLSPTEAIDVDILMQLARQAGGAIEQVDLSRLVMTWPEATAQER